MQTHVRVLHLLGNNRTNYVSRHRRSARSPPELFFMRLVSADTWADESVQIHYLQAAFLET